MLTVAVKATREDPEKRGEAGSVLECGGRCVVRQGELAEGNTGAPGQEVRKSLGSTSRVQEARAGGRGLTGTQGSPPLR